MVFFGRNVSRVWQSCSRISLLELFIRSVWKWGLGIDGKNQVYLDLSHLPAKYIDERLGGIVEIYEKFHGDDPRKFLMKIFPRCSLFHGRRSCGLEPHDLHPGLFAAGECDYMYHGANRLGANSLLSALYSGTVVGPAAAAYVSGLDHSAEETRSSLFESYRKKEEEYDSFIRSMHGTENPYILHREMGELMTKNVTVVPEQ